MGVVAYVPEQIGGTMIRVEDLEDYYYRLHQLKMKMITLQGNTKVEITDREITIIIAMIDITKEGIEKRIVEEEYNRRVKHGNHQ